ncbi:MAG: hypothetical protein WA948_06225 [Pontixanthobacter sp.]
MLPDEVDERKASEEAAAQSAAAARPATPPDQGRAAATAAADRCLRERGERRGIAAGPHPSHFDVTARKTSTGEGAIMLITINRPFGV